MKAATLVAGRRSLERKGPQYAYNLSSQKTFQSPDILNLVIVLCCLAKDVSFL